MIALSIDEFLDNRVTIRIIWVDYYELIGVVGDAPEDLYYLAKGVFPWSTPATDNQSAQTTKRQILVKRERLQITRFDQLFGWMDNILDPGKRPPVERQQRRKYWTNRVAWLRNMKTLQNMIPKNARLVAVNGIWVRSKETKWVDSFEYH